MFEAAALATVKTVFNRESPSEVLTYFKDFQLRSRIENKTQEDIMLESSGNRHCKKCTRPDEADNMVGCDACDAWEHYGCAGVSDSIAGSNRSWMCEDCRRQALAAASSRSATSAYNSASSKRSRQAQLRLELLEQQNQVRMKKLEEEERYLKEKFDILMQLEDEDDLVSSNRSQVSVRSKRDRLEKWLEQEGTVATEDERDFEREVGRKSGIPEVMQAAAKGRHLTIPAFETQSVSRKLDKQASVECGPKISTPTPLKNIAEHADPTVSSKVRDNMAVPPPTRQCTQQFEYVPSVQPIRPGMSVNTRDCNARTTIGASQPAPTSVRYAQPQQPQNYHPDPVTFGPTTSQLAARQVMPRDLPIFSGDPEDWPIFYSSFVNSTQVCGYSDAENLARLQRCLRGSALESVRSRLLLPSSVDSVIATLRIKDAVRT